MESSSWISMVEEDEKETLGLNCSSCKKCLKALALSPKQSDGTKHEEPVPERKFLLGSHAIKPLTSVATHLPNNPDSSNFNESWPDSEQPSSPSLTTEDRWSQQSVPYPSVRKHVQPTFISRHVHLDRPFIQTGSDQLIMKTAAGLRSEAVGEGEGHKGSGVERSAVHSQGKKGKVVDSGQKEGVEGKGSVLQRYIERFRHGAPMSREERLRQERNQRDEFWWLDSGLPTPNSTSTSKEEGRSLGLNCQGQGTLTMENVRKQDALDMATAQLQEKADRVLHSAGSVMSSGPVVSTDGLGSTGSDVSMTHFSVGRVTTSWSVVSTDGLGSTGSDVTGSSFSEAAVRPSFLPREMSAPYPRAERQARKGGASAAAPQEDILFQWRLQRKLETARQAPYVATAGSAHRPPRTAAEADIERRLAGFRESLLGRGSVVQTQLLQARVEKDMKQVQSMMDTAVQTSPVKTPPPPSLSSHPPSHPSSWSSDHGTGALSQDCQGRSSSQPTKHLMSTTCDDAERMYDDAKRSVLVSDTDTCVGGSELVTGKADRCFPSHVQYRQFLEAERPQDGGDPALTRPSSHTQRSDSVPTADRTSTETDHDDHVPRPRSSKSTDRAKRDPAMRRKQVEIAQPHEGGDVSSTEVKGRGHTRLPDGGDGGSELAARDTDSDSGSTHSCSQGEGRRAQRNGKQTSKQQRRETRRAELSSPVQDNQNNNRAREAESSSNLKDDGRLPEDVGDRQANLPHRKPPTDTAGQLRSGGERVQRSGVMPPPQSSSSPARTPLSSAIGQVVEKRLFDMSVSVLSSVDSVSSLQRSAVSPSPAMPPVSMTADSDLESDGEFENDPLLLVLRQQRQTHEAQLQCLDSILAERNAP